MFSVLGFGRTILHGRKSRIGIFGNNQHDCDTCDSVIGFGIKIASLQTSSKINQT